MRKPKNKPCTKHKYKEQICIRCGHTCYKRGPTSPRFYALQDYTQKIVLAVKQLIEKQSPPIAEKPSDPAKRTDEWEEKARTWEYHAMCQWHCELHKLWLSICEQENPGRENRKTSRLRKRLGKIIYRRGPGYWFILTTQQIELLRRELFVFGGGL